MTSEDLERHIELLDRLSEPGQALDANAPTATVNNRKWWLGKGRPTQIRQELHRRLIAEAREKAPGLKQERKAYIFAGPPGAGKSRLREKILGAEGGDFLIIDPDEFKKALLLEALADGSYDAIVPQEIRDLEAAGEKFFPLELASLVHEESSFLAKKLRDKAISQGDNIIIDSVFGSVDTAKRLARELTAANYKVEVIVLDVPEEFSLAQALGRWARARMDALKGKNQLGGRLVPKSFIKSLFDRSDGKSRPVAVALGFTKHCRNVVRCRFFSKTMEQLREPNAIASLDREFRRESPGAPLVEVKRKSKGSKRTTPGPAPGPAFVKPATAKGVSTVAHPKGRGPSMGSPNEGRS